MTIDNPFLTAAHGFTNDRPRGGVRPARGAKRLGRLLWPIVLITLSALWLPAAAYGDNYTAPGPFFFLDKGNSWYFNQGFMKCWTGDTPKAGCPENTVTLTRIRPDGHGEWVLGKTNNKIETPYLRYVRFQTGDALIPYSGDGPAYLNAVHCGPVAYRLIVDGNVVMTTGLLGPTATTGARFLPYPIRRGKHNIRVRLVGDPSGCEGNTDLWAVGQWFPRNWGLALWLWNAPAREDLSGTVLEGDSDPMAGLEIIAREDEPQGHTYKIATGADGAFTFNLPAGNYIVAPRSPSGGPVFNPAKRTVHLNQDVSGVNFVRAADELDMETSASRLIDGLWWTTATAGGAAKVVGTARLRNARNEPLRDRPVRIGAPYWDVAPPGSTEPEIVICDDSWRGVYPGTGFERITDTAGKIRFTMLLGGSIGNFFLHANDPSDAVVFDVERFGQLGTYMGPNEDIVMTLQNAVKLGLPKPPLAGTTQAGVQEGLLDWLLWYRFGEYVGAAAQSPWGEFGPIRNAEGSHGGIVLYPSGNPGPLRRHLTDGTALPGGYTTLAIPIKYVVVLGKPTWYVDFGGGAGLKDLAAWELEYGPARAGFAGRDGGDGPAWFGGPYPPPSTDAAARTAFNRCVPGAAPRVAGIEVHSPLRLLITDPNGNKFGYDNGALVDEIGGYLVPGGKLRPATYIVPSGTYQVGLRGTGSGRAGLVARVPMDNGESVRAFSFGSRKGATGRLALTGAGAADSLKFDGRIVPAWKGLPLAVRGLPRQVLPRRRVKFAIRVVSRYGQAVEGALVAVTGKKISTRTLTNRLGNAALSFKSPRYGRVLVRVTAPGCVTMTKTILVSALP